MTKCAKDTRKQQNNIHITTKYSVAYKIAMCINYTDLLPTQVCSHSIHSQSHDYHIEFINTLRIYDSYEGNTVYSQVSLQSISLPYCTYYVHRTFIINTCTPVLHHEHF